MTTVWVRALASASSGALAGMMQTLTNNSYQQELQREAGAGGNHMRFLEGPNKDRRLQQPAKSIYEARSTSGPGDAYFLETAARCSSAKAAHDHDTHVRHDCGEDAFFIANSSRSATALGIADGVGQWSSYGIDPAAFSWGLMMSCQAVAEEGETQPLYILAEGFDQLAKESKLQYGSSTACVASFDCISGRLRIANLGDSGALVLNYSGKCKLETAPQQHAFNQPYQLMLAEDGFGDYACDADRYSVMVQEGDILILATDGLFDNLWPDEVKCVVNSLHDEGPGTIAEALVSAAHKRSHGSQFSPFSHACLQHRLVHEGGKPDDITVVASRIKQAEDTSTV